MKKLLYSILTFVALTFATTLTAQVYNMANAGTIGGACGGTFYDSGGSAGAYANGESLTETFCAPAGQYITFTFTSFQVESSFEHLNIYNGPTTGSALIGSYTGTGTPGTVTSTLGGCLTFTFTSDGSITFPGWAASISCSSTLPPPPPPAPNTCGTANAFCTATGSSYPASTGSPAAPAGANYGCLGSEPNPAFYYLNIATSGAITIALSNSAVVDIDFACWGPFATQAAMCAAIYGAVPPAPISCSYSGSATETVSIPGAVAGQWYMLMITNFSNAPTNINAVQSGGTGTTNCAILCNMTALTAVPSACAAPANTYSVTGQITLAYPPTTGTLTVSSSCGGSTTVPLPWTSPITYTLPGLTPTGGGCTLTATFSADPTCSLTVPYTSPAPCNTCTATATNTGPYCAGSTVQLNSTGGGTYSWAGPGGYTSAAQNPTRPGSTVAMSGTYTVTVTNGGATCTATTIVTVNPDPVATIPANISVCAGTAIPASAFASTPAGATFNWTNSNAAIGLGVGGAGNTPGFVGTNATTNPITGTITVTPTLGACIGAAITYTITINPIPVSTFTPSANTCFTGNTFSFTNTGTLGTYAWNFGGATVNTSTVNNPAGVTYPAAGTYTVTHTVTTAAGCSSTTTATVTVYAAPTALVVTSVNASCGLSNGVINIGAVTGGTAAYTYSVNGSPFAGTLSYPGFAAGTYTVVVKDANGCQFTTTVNVTNSPGPTALGVTSVNSTCGASNGIINIGTTTGGTAAYTYSVNGSPFTATTSYAGFAAGTYTVIVKDANGCTFSTTINVVNTPGPTALAVTAVNSTCGASNGVINIGVVTGGTAAYTYSVNGSPFTATISYPAFAAGTYTVIVKDANGCTFTRTITVVNSPGPTALAVAVTNASCGASNGTITIGVVTGGTAAFTYSVNGGPFTGTTAYAGFAAGTYSVIVKDANGCTFTTSATIVNSSGPTALAVTSTNASCGSTTGTATIGAVTGGIAAFTYSFNGSPFTSTTSYLGLASGTYTVIVKDANGCTFTTSVTVGSNGAPTALATTTTNSTCGTSNGVITIGAVTGGIAPYTYSVNGSPFTTTTVYGAMAAGTYTVIVKDVNGCTFSTTATIINSPGPTALAVSTVNSICGATNGSITIGVVTGGSPAYTYSVNGSPFTATLTYPGFSSGTYIVIVKDANGCTFNTNATVVNTPGPTALATATINSTCGASNGTVNIGAVTGGAAAYTYSFNGSPFTATISYTGLAAGTYTVIVKDANGCQFTTTATVANTPGPTALATTFTNPTCGNSNGTITIGVVTGGVGPYTYSFNGGGFTATTNYTGLAAGTYPIIVKDANGCTFTINRVIANIPGPTALATTTTNAACGASTGSITIGATTGGTLPYTYSVNGSPFTATTNYPGLAANTYPVIVQDANGCQFATTATVANSTGPTALVVNTTNAACGASTGTITIGATTGGVGPFSYSVNGSPFTATTNYTGFAGGTYTVIVKDANGCTFSTTATVNPTVGPTALVVSNTNATCGLSNGTITIGAVTGGTAAYTYSVNASAFTATTSYTGFAAGTYTVIVKDANGCQFTTTTTIINVPGPTAIATTITSATCGASNGAVVLGSVTGGTPAYTYSFNGSPFTGTTTYNILASGTYSIIVKDLNGCTFTTSAVVPNIAGPTALATTLTSSTCGNSNGSITIGATTGGTAAYTYSFNGGGFTATTSYTGLAAGIYPIIVQDANGCQFTISRTITNVAGPTALATTTTNASCGASNGSVTIGATTGGTAAFTYSFNGAGFSAATNYPGLAANSYTIIVQDANGCQFTTTAIVNNSSGPTALAVAHVDATCGNSNGTATIGATTGGVLPLSYSFNGGAFSTTTNYTGLAAGTYSVIVKDANGCTFTTSVVISNIAGPTALAVTNTPASCGLANGTLTIGAVTGGTVAYTYSVNASAFTATTNYTLLVGGTYTIIVKDGNGCTFTTTSTIANTPGPTAIATTITNSTCGNSNGAVALGAVTGGTPAYLYSFNGSPFTATISYTALAAGSYSIIVKDANGCTFTTSANVINIPGPTAQATTTNSSTCGLSNGAVNIGTTTGGAAAYTYSFNGGGFTATTGYTGLSAGTYTVTVKDANGCTFTVNPVVTNVPGPTAVATTITNSTCGAANGAISIGATTGGTPPYTYSVNGSSLSATTNYPGLVANTYTVIVQDANGCQFTTTATVTDLSGLSASITAITNVSCFGGNNGSVTVTASGSTGPYSYSFNGAAFVGSGTFVNLVQGSYTVTAKDGNGCTVIVPVTIIQPTALTGVITSQTNVNCFGGATGSVTVSASGGVNPYVFELDAGPFVASPTFTGLSAGTHTITIKDANGCIFIITVTITQPAVLVLVPSSTNATCTAANGSATVTVSGGTPLYGYLWTPSGQTTSTAINLTANNYSVLVTDANGCSQTVNISVGANPGGTAVISSSSNVSCASGSDGTATVSMGAGATPPFTYSWTPGSQTTATAINLTPASYNVTVIDGNGCISTASVVITQPTVLTNTFTNTNVSCFGGNNGISTINPAGGTPGYTYFWTPGGYTTQTVTNLAAGTYTCVFTDANGCVKTVTTSITQPTGMTLSTTHVDANCNLANGSAVVSVAGGTGPYTYLWSDPGAQTTITASSLASNTYVVTVTDANSCTQSIPVTISNLAGPTAAVFSSNNVSCFGNNDGSATVVITSGTAPFTFVWSDGQALPTATNLASGSYTMTATDGNGCIASTSVTITEPTLLDGSMVSTNPSCYNACNGSISSIGIGGTPPYAFLWSPGGITTSNIGSLCAGTYTLQVTDAHGCVVFKPTILVDPVAVTATNTTTNVTCSGLCNGTATANPATGTGPFTYAWNDINAQTTQTATGICAGTYTCTVTDANGCTGTTTAVITSPNSLGISISSQGNNTCFNACDGFASATVVGGSAPFSYFWNPISVAGSSVNNLCAGTFTVTVTDGNGCSANTSVTITQPVALTATISSTNVTCYNACNGSATAVYNGGTGPYTFQWTPSFLTTPTIINICAGVQNLTVSDANGCTANAIATITEPTILAVSTTTTNSNCGVANGSACAAITGGVPPFSYLWNDPSSQTTSCANSINAGVYTISITDGHGCSVTNVANVNDNTAPVVTIPTSANVTCNGAANGSAQAAIAGGIVPYNILWTPSSQTTAFASGLSGGIYSVIVTDAAGCIGSASVTINEPGTLVSGILSSSNVSCFLSCNGSAAVGAGGGTAPYTYLWNDAATQTTATATGLCAQGYTVTITDANLCVSTSSTVITSPTAISVSMVSTANVSCFGGNNGAITISATGGTPGYTYAWTPSVGSSPTVTGLAAGTYTVVVTDQNGCSSTLTITVNQPTAIALTTVTNPSTCSNPNGFVSVSPLGGSPAYSYLWNDPSSQTTAIATALYAGTYSVTVTDSHGCTADTTVILIDKASPTIGSLTFTEPACNGYLNGSAIVVPAGGQPGYTYLWTPSGQTTQMAGALASGTYQVLVTDANLCTVIGTVIVTQPSATQIIVSPRDTICIGQVAQIYGAGYGGTPIYTYTWTPPTWTFGGPNSVTPIVTTTYDVYATDQNLCNSPSQTITVFVNPPIVVVATDVSVCYGNTVGISATIAGGNGGPYSYIWTPPTGLSSDTISNPNATPLITTDYIVTVDDGCTLPSYSAFDTATVTVNPLAVSFMLASDTAGCEDFTVTFNAISDIGTNFSWDFGDASPIQPGEPVTYTYPNPGIYNVTLTVTTALGCTSSVTNNSFIDVYPAPTAAFITSPAEITETAPQVTFTDQSTTIGTISSWAWDFDSPNGIYTDTLQNPAYSFNDTGSYNVQLIVINSYGCPDTAYNTVDVIPEYAIYVPNAFTPNNHDGINDMFIPQGVGFNPDNFEMTIFDRWGNLIYKTSDINKGWDGKANGGSKIAEIDTYVWKITTVDFRTNSHQYIGHVTIVK